MKKIKMFLSMLLLAVATTGINAAAPALGDALAKDTKPENGKMYYIYADTYSGGNYVNRYLYNNSGTLALNTSASVTDMNYVWLCSVNNDKYIFQNVGDNSKYLAHKALAGTAYYFTLGKANATHNGVTIWSDAAERYLVTKNDGTKFDQANRTYNQSTEDWCTDYVFVEYIERTGNTLNISANISGAGEIAVNGTATTMPYTTWSDEATLPVTITAKAINPYKFIGFFEGETNKGNEITVETLTEDLSYEARFELDLFSTADNLVPVRIYNNRDKGYCIRMNVNSSYDGANVNSGSGTYGENEIWYLVGTAESFKLHNKVAGSGLALTLAGTTGGSAATLSAAGTELCLVEQTDGSYGICPKGTEGQSFNMHGGAGNDIKLYETSDGGSKWLLKKVSTNPLTLNYNTQLDGGYEQNYKIGELAINIDGAESKSMLTKTTIPASTTCYLPEGATFGISASNILYGWKMDINGETAIENQTVPAEGLEVNINIAVDTENKRQYLYYSPSAEGHPYRIPAITTTANGYVFAINDYRPCGNDIGYGEVDLVMRYSTAAGEEWDGHSWTDPIKIADGEGAAAHDRGETWKVGYGDPAIVADRENNELLVMSVCGNRTCWDGNYGVGGENENPNRVSRIRIKFDEAKKEWIVGAPEEVTYDIYPLFKDANDKVHVRSMFIGAGRIAQSSKIKVGTHYRIYCAVWALAEGNGQHHNYALYSDDFGETWNVLGELGYDNCPSKWGNEPKCEELPDGSVLLSSRKYNGRYFNVFRYTDAEKGEGYWEGEVSTDVVGDLKWGGNSTNGEPLLVGNVLLQSAPTGNNRSDVALFYKILSNDPADYTPTKLSNGWTKVPVSNKESAYSAMCILPGGEEIGFFYEEVPGGYSMVYLPLNLKEILSEEAYNAMNKSELFTAISKTEELITRCKKDDFEAELSTKEGDSYYIWSNAPQSGSSVEELLDNTASTFFHTNWESTTAPADGLDHHLTIELGDGNGIAEFKFCYQARSGGGLGDYPTTIKVQGSNDGSNYTDITTVEPRNDNGDTIENGTTWTSETIGDGNTYTFLRFMVTATTTNKKKDGHIFWHMAEFDLLYKKIIPQEVLTAIAQAEAAVAVAKEAMNATQTAEEYAAEVKAINDARNALLIAIGEEIEDGIETLTPDIITEENSSIFDLTGRKVKNITLPGIYIINGQKVLVK